MPSKYWIKLYHEALHDPKMGRLSDHLYRRCIELFLLAGETDAEGALPPVGDMAWTLRTSDDALTQDLVQLAETGIVTKSEAGWIVTKFAARQEAVSGSERVQRYRERNRRAEYKCNVPVTKRYTDTDTDVDTDTTTARACEPEPTTPQPQPEQRPEPSLLGKLLDSAGVIVGGIMQTQAWQAVEEDCGGDAALLEETFAEMAKGSGRPTAKWASTIIERCKREGCRPGQWRTGGNGRHAPPGHYEPGQDADMALYTRVALDGVTEEDST